LLILNYYDTAGTGTLSLTDIIYYTTGSATTVNENIPVTSKFKVYPNPATDILHIKLERQTNENAEIILTDATGRIVRQVNVNGKRDVVLDIADLPAGMYIAQVKCLSASAIQKVMIVR
jgi:hypothetical protein